MAAFGSFETDREVYSGPAYTVYSARKQDDPGTEYAIKVFSLLPSGLDSEAGEDLAPLISDIEQSCMDRIAVQQKAATASPFVSPILETGRDERGVWYATRFYPRSVNKIISGRVELSRDALEHIIRSLAQGALDIKRACGRSHGTIEPSNIQISRSPRLSEADIVLSDPLPGDETEAARYELSDLRAIGRVLLQLVLRRAIEDESALIFPVLISPEWTRLFRKDAEAWLALCNRLLDPNLSLEQFHLEQLAEQLGELRSKPPVSREVLLAAAALLVVLGAGGVLARNYFSRAELLVTSDPPGAEIKVLEKAAPRSLGKTPLDGKPLRLRLPKGAHTLRAEYPGLLEQTAAVEVGRKPAQEFLFPYGRVQITSTPADATVELGGNKVGPTPFASSALPPGEMTFYVRSVGFNVAKLTVAVPADRTTFTTNAVLTLAPVNAGTVEFDSQPRKARISVGGVHFDETPFLKTLSAGTHKITAQFEDWPPITEEVVIRPGENPTKTFYLPHGTAQFSMEPEDTRVMVGGKTLEAVRRKAFQPGSYVVRFERQGYEPQETNISIADGKTIPVSIKLKPMLGFVEFTSDPPGASIFELKAPDEPIGRTEPGQPLKRSFPPGTYAFVARYEGLDPVSKPPVNVAMGSSLALPFAFSHASVRFETQPPGAELWIAGKPVQSTPYVHYQKPGPLSYRFELADYEPEEGATNLTDRQALTLSLPLRPRKVEVVLRSDPPGARFFLGQTALSGSNDLYAVPWGTHQIVARHLQYSALAEVTNAVEVRKSPPNSHQFKFDYGTVILTNVPEDVVIKAGAQPLTDAGGPVRLAYVRPGSYTFDLYDGDRKVESVTADVQPGLLAVLKPSTNIAELVGEIRNSIGMRLVKVRNVLGPGRDAWVGKYEVTQREFQLVMGNNPSGPPLGDNLPVQNVSWDQAIQFCQRLRAHDEKKPPVRGAYNLPSLEQWQIFAAGTEFKDAVVGVAAPAEVGSKPANRQRLHDVLGNVWEWLANSDQANGVYIGAAYNIGFGRQFGKWEMRAKSFTGADVGFRVILAPPDAQTSAAAAPVSPTP